MARRPSGQGWGESGGGVRLVEPDVESWAARRRRGPTAQARGRPADQVVDELQPARAHNDLQGRWPGDGPACAWRPSCRPAEPARKSCRPWSRTAVSSRRGGGAASRRGGSTAAVPDDQVLELEAGQAVGIVVELAGCPQLRTVTAAGPRGGPVAGHCRARSAARVRRGGSWLVAAYLPELNIDPAIPPAPAWFPATLMLAGPPHSVSACSHKPVVRLVLRDARWFASRCSSTKRTTPGFRAVHPPSCPMRSEPEGRIDSNVR